MFLRVCLSSFSQSHYAFQTKHQEHCVGHADTCCAGHVGLRLRVLPGRTFSGSYGLPLHVGYLTSSREVGGGY